MRRFVFGHAKFGIAYVPVFDSIFMNMGISTRSGNIIVNKGDGSADYNFTPTKNYDYAGVSPSNLAINYSPAFSGDFSLKILKGAKDVYSLFLGTIHTNDNYSKLNIQDLALFFSQFPNLYSVRINEGSIDPSYSSIIKGDFSQFPLSTERVLIQGISVKNITTDLFLNLSNYNKYSLLKVFNYEGNSGSGDKLKTIGDLGKIPPLVNFFKLAFGSSDSAITYTSGKVWASSFDTLYIAIPLTNSETDNIFTDLDNSVNTAIGGKNITLLNSFRTPSVDSKIISLKSKGFSANCNQLRSYETLGSTITTPNFYAYIPDTTSLDFGTQSLRFGCSVKFNDIPTTTIGLIGKTVLASKIGRYGIYTNGGNINVITQLASSNIVNSTSITPYNDGNFHAIEVECNRITGKQTLKIDGVLINTQTFTPSSNNITCNAQFMIAVYGNSTGTGLQGGTELNGIVKDVFVSKF